MGLSTRVTTIGLITMHGTKYRITTDEYQRLMNLSLDDMFAFDGNAIKVSTVAETMPIAELDTQYPEKPKPEFKHIEFGTKSEDLMIEESKGVGMNGIFEKAPKKGREQMIKGLQGFCDKNPNALKAADLLSHMKLKMP
jgi:hypothetical protein